MQRRDPVLAFAMAVGLVVAAGAEPAKRGGLFDVGEFGNSKEPISVVADNLEYDYKANVVTYRGDVRATQGTVKLRSDTLTVTFARAKPAAQDLPAEGTSDVPDTTNMSGRVQEVVASGNVRIDQGARWASGGKAIFDQARRTLVLTDDPVLHDGPNEVAGDRVVVYLDEDRSVVEGGRKRVKAVLYPGKEDARTPSNSPSNSSEAVARP